MMLRRTRGIRRVSAGRVVGCGFSVCAAACARDPTAPLARSLVPVTSGANQSGTVNATLTQPIAVLVTDSNGRPVSGVAVTFTPNTNAGSVSSAQATTDNAGLAQVNWKIGTAAGLDSMTVSIASESAIVTAIGTADGAAQVTVVSGNSH